jgi:hypothetical protein
MEGALLCNALADQLARRFGRALAATALACFAEPSMPYAYGAVLSLLALLHLQRTAGITMRSVGHTFGPAVAAATATAAALALWMGPVSLLRTILPLHGVGNYHAAHNGLLASHLLFFSGVRIGWYLGTVSGFWILSGLLLLAGGAISGLKVWMLEDRRAELILTCAILQLTFASVMFGSLFSTIYYFYILLAGLTGILAGHSSNLVRVAGGALIAISLIGHKAEAAGLRTLWQETRPQSSMAGLWDTSHGAAEWTRVLKLRHGRPASVLAATQALDLIFPGFMPPVALYLTPGYPIHSEQARVAEQLRAASVVIVPDDVPEFRNAITNLQGPEFRSALDDTTLAFRGTLFGVYERRAAAEATLGTGVRQRGDSGPMPIGKGRAGGFGAIP